MSQKGSACQISVDSEQLEKSNRNRYIRLSLTESFNYQYQTQVNHGYHHLRVTNWGIHWAPGGSVYITTVTLSKASGLLWSEICSGLMTFTMVTSFSTWKQTRKTGSSKVTMSKVNSKFPIQLYFHQLKMLLGHWPVYQAVKLVHLSTGPRESAIISYPVQDCTKHYCIQNNNHT